MENPEQMCHLCFASNGSSSSLVVLNDEELTAKIHRIFYFEVTFPPYTCGLICMKCVTIIEEFSCYAEQVARNQEQLRGQLLATQIKVEELDADVKSPEKDDVVPMATVPCPSDPFTDDRMEDDGKGLDKEDVPVEFESVDTVAHESHVFKVEEVHEEQEEDEEKEEYLPETDSESEQSFSENETIVVPTNEADQDETPSKLNKESVTAEPLKEGEPTLSTESIVLQRYKLSCDICSAPLTDFADLNKHYKQEHNVTGYLRCCNKKILKRCWMIEHLLLHINPDTFRCEQCAKSYSSSRVLKEHMKEVHAAPSDRSFPCTTCGKAFVSRSHLNAHVMVAHGSVPCKQCDKVLASQGSLRHHMVAVHGEGQKYVCDVCARVFRSKQCFATHLKVHEGNRTETKVQCELCNAWLTDKNCLSKHMRRVHAEDTGDPVTCGKCGKEVRNQSALTNHMWRMHRDTGLKCELCNKQFNRPQHMREHVAIHHTGEEIYGCQYCSERFNTKNKQYKHRKTVHPKEFAEELRKRQLKE